MPCIKEFQVDTSKPVLVTGATGYVAGVLIRQLLEKGANVHATVRDPSQKDRIQYLQNVADKNQRHGGSIKFFKGNLLEWGSFDEAAKGCGIIFHTASPFVLDKSKDPNKDLIEPAVYGTENILTTANNTPTIQRVVLTSSSVAIYGHANEVKTAPNGILTEEMWNRTSTLADAYSLSKTLAEQKAWVMAGSQTQWDLVTINPSMVQGPGLIFHESSESQNLAKQLANGEMKAGAPDIAVGVVDVRDVAAAHIAAAYLAEAQGRYILSGHNTSIVGIGKALKETDKNIPAPTSALPKLLVWMLAPYVGMTREFVSKNIGVSMNLDNTKSKTELGIEYYPLEKTMADVYQHMSELGIVEEPKK